MRDWLDDRRFSALLKRATRAAVKHTDLSQSVTEAFQQRYGTTFSDLDIDDLIEPLDYGQTGAAPSVRLCDDLMAMAGHPLRKGSPHD